MNSIDKKFKILNKSLKLKKKKIWLSIKKLNQLKKNIAKLMQKQIKKILE